MSRAEIFEIYEILVTRETKKTHVLEIVKSTLFHFWSEHLVRDHTNSAK
jgi:hypothetical protein